MRQTVNMEKSFSKSKVDASALYPGSGTVSGTRGSEPHTEIKDLTTLFPCIGRNPLTRRSLDAFISGMMPYNLQVVEHHPITMRWVLVPATFYPAVDGGLWGSGTC